MKGILCQEKREWLPLLFSFVRRNTRNGHKFATGWTSMAIATITLVVGMVSILGGGNWSLFSVTLSGVSPIQIWRASNEVSMDPS